MKKLVIALSCITALTFGGCKEVPPSGIIFGTAKAHDTTYVGAVPAAQTHNVLVEEFTGESCSNCPPAHAALDALVAGHPAGAINVISLYQNAQGLSLPPTGANFDLRNQKASDISASVIYGTNADNTLGSLPGAGIDRVPPTPGTTIWLPLSSWADLIGTQLNIANPINLDVSSTVAAGVATIVVKVTYTHATSALQNLSIAIVEDSIVDAQEIFGGINPAYVFKDVFVDLVTSSPYGDPLLDTIATKEAGRVVQRVYSYTVPTAFAKGSVNPNQCRVIAFVHAPSSTTPDFHVYQSQQTKLMGP